MHTQSLSTTGSRPSTALILLCLILAVLWLAGGASRADVMGQVVVRAAAWAVLIAATLFGAPLSAKAARPVFILLAASVLLTLLQLVPLPPTIWQALPGRGIFAEAAAATDQAQPLRPWAIVPAGAVNAASAMIVPVAVLIASIGLTPRERAYLPTILLGLVIAATVLGLLQLSGAGLDNPLINDSVGAVGSIFANRNHFALFLAFGCLLASVWAFLEGRRSTLRGSVALGLVLLFTLTILATGSRAGLILGVLAIVFGLTLAWQGVRRSLRHAPRWAFPALIMAIITTMAVFVLLSILAERAVSIDRTMLADAALDRRGRSFPTVLAMIGSYFPFGSGFGGFDQAFRMHEPFVLLMPTYFNHAHNDFLEIVLDGGLPAILLLGAAIAWWAIASLRAWRAGPEAQHVLPKLGSAMLLLVFVASLVDYPARTPMMMAMIVIAAVWLAGATPRAALPGKSRHL